MTACSAVVSGLIAAGLAEAGTCFWLLFGLMLIGLIILGRRDSILASLIGLSPLIELLRQAALYNIVVILLGIASIYCALATPALARNLLVRCRLLVYICLFLTAYYTASLLITRAYEIHLRDFEFVFAAFLVMVLARNKELLAAALKGLMISAWAIGVGMLPHISSVADLRLGEINVGGHRLGNPVQLGVPLALTLLALIVDRGAWLGLQNKPVKRVLCLIPTVILLGLTASRAAWLVSVVGIITVLVFPLSSRLNSRAKILVVVAVAAVAVRVLLLGSAGEALEKGFVRTFDESSASHRTSGRSDQWVVAYYAFTHSLGSVLHGYGPGLGPRVYAEYSRSVEDIEYRVGEEAQLHSLYMEVAVETGLLGLVPLLAWLALTFARIFRRVRAVGVLFPMVCFLGWLSITLSVGVGGVVSGTYMGIALLGTLTYARRGRPVLDTGSCCVIDQRVLAGKKIREPLQIARRRIGFPGAEAFKAGRDMRARYRPLRRQGATGIALRVGEAE